MTAIAARFKTRLGRTLALVAALVVMTAATMPSARAQNVSIIRDAEIEGMIRDFAVPLLDASGINVTPRVYIVADRGFNAFVIEDGSIFVNYGTLIEVKDTLALKAILAHEIGHVAGGHLSRLREQANVNVTLQAVAMVLGVGAAAASSASGGPQLGGLATAFILASQSAGTNSLMAFRRSEESAADAAGLKLLERTGQSGRGMVEVLKYLKAEEAAGYSAFVRTHPDAGTRLDQVEPAAKSLSNWGKTGSARDNERLALARAKVIGFLESRQTVVNTYPNADKSLAGRYARVITAYKSGAGVSAIPVMADLAAAAPSNAYFQELLGQMYFETGNAAKATAPLARAIKLAPKEPLIRVLYGQALLAAGNPDEAILQLRRAATEDAESVLAFTVLSRAYAAIGEMGEASLAAAEAALGRGDKGVALGLARKAQSELAAGSPGWLRADDILSLTH
jgi:predicted Zn-dependent protease